MNKLKIILPSIKLFFYKIDIRQIIFYFLQLSSKMKQLSDPTSLMLLRLDFLRIVCSHEHFLPLNLPFGTPLTPASGHHSPTSSVSSRSSITSSSTLVAREKQAFHSLTPQFRGQHYLVGLILSDLAVSFDYM